MEKSYRRHDICDRVCVKTVFFGLCCTDCSKERRLKWIWFGLTAQQLACTVLDSVVTSVTICFLVLYNSLFCNCSKKVLFHGKIL